MLRDKSFEKPASFLSRAFEWNNEEEMLTPWSLPTHRVPISEGDSPSEMQWRRGMEKLGLVSYSRAVTRLFREQSILNLYIFNIILRCHLLPWASNKKSR